MDEKELELDRAQAERARQEKVKLRLFEELSRSVTGIHVDPVPDKGADGVATFLDQRSVLHRHPGDYERRMINLWLSHKIKLEAEANDRLAKTIRRRFGDQGFRVNIMMLDQHGGWERCWFELVKR